MFLLEILIVLVNLLLLLFAQVVLPLSRHAGVVDLRTRWRVLGTSERLAASCPTWCSALGETILGRILAHLDLGTLFHGVLGT
jgi:hypothetical protein